MVEPVAYTIREAAEALRVSRTHIYNLINQGLIRRVKVGSRSLIPATELYRVLEHGTSPQSEREE